MEINEAYTQIADDDLLLRTDCRYFEVYGGRRSGKSHDVAAIICLTALRQAGHFIPIIRKVGATLKDSVFAEYVSFFRTNNLPHEVNKTDKEITLPNGSRFRAFGLDDADKLKSLKDATIIHVEEANEITEDDFDSLDAGLSPGNYPGRIVLTHNPVPQIPGSLHWIQKRFLQTEHELSKAKVIETPAGKALILRTWYKDNAFCPESTIKVLEGYKESNPEKYKLWALGEFTKLEGVVYNNWDIVKQVPEGVQSIGCGLDFGFSADPAACVRVWIHRDELYIQQLVYSTDLTNTDLVKAMRESGVQEKEIITADSAEPKSIEDIKREGFRMIRGVKKRANYKEDMANRIRSYKIHILEGSTDLIREISTYSWSRDRMGKQLPKLQDGDDHALDAMLMRMHDYWGDNKIKPATVSLRL